MQPMDAAGNSSSVIECVTATVTLQPAFTGDQFPERTSGDAGGDRPARIQMLTGRSGPDKLALAVCLSAQDSAGQLISSESTDMGLGLWRRGVNAIYRRYHGPPIPANCDEVEFINRTYRAGLPDIEDAINHMLGRDPEQEDPPRLAWGNLIRALANAGLSMDEQELIATPLSVVLTPEVQAELDQS